MGGSGISASPAVRARAMEAGALFIDPFALSPREADRILDAPLPKCANRPMWGCVDRFGISPLEKRRSCPNLERPNFRTRLGPPRRPPIIADEGRAAFWAHPRRTD